MVGCKSISLESTSVLILNYRIAIMKIEENYSLRAHNTFDIYVRCKYFVESDNEADWQDFFTSYELKPEEIIILGKGSNYLFTDNFKGSVLYPTIKGIEIVSEKEDRVIVRVGAGEIWDDFVEWAVDHGYGGIENLSLIPGHVGASPVQNIGAYGVEVQEVITMVEAIDIEKAQKVFIDTADCHFSYRDSIFKKEWKNKFLVTYVRFELKKQPVFHLDYGSIKDELTQRGGEITLRAIRDAIISIRRVKLPDVKIMPNAGSFFKNPVVKKEIGEQLREKYIDMPVYPINDEYVKLAAGWLIEQCGWRGRTIGNVGVHAKQALVLINLGNASGIEVAHLANEIKKSVFVRFGVFIEPEVYVI